jgi:hypothetical protein
MERRRFSRPRLRVNVQACTDQRPIGHILNITDQGVCLVGKGMPPKTLQSLVLKLPFKLSGLLELHVEAEPLWHRYLDNGHWRSGFRLTMDDDTAIILTTLVSRYGE